MKGSYDCKDRSLLIIKKKKEQKEKWSKISTAQVFKKSQVWRFVVRNQKRCKQKFVISKKINRKIERSIERYSLCATMGFSMLHIVLHWNSLALFILSISLINPPPWPNITSLLKTFWSLVLFWSTLVESWYEKQAYGVREFILQ